MGLLTSWFGCNAILGNEATGFRTLANDAGGSSSSSGGSSSGESSSGGSSSGAAGDAATSSSSSSSGASLPPIEVISGFAPKQLAATDAALYALGTLPGQVERYELSGGAKQPGVSASAVAAGQSTLDDYFVLENETILRVSDGGAEPIAYSNATQTAADFVVSAVGGVVALVRAVPNGGKSICWTTVAAPAARCFYGGYSKDTLISARAEAFIWYEPGSTINLVPTNGDAPGFWSLPPDRSQAEITALATDPEHWLIALREEQSSRLYELGLDGNQDAAAPVARLVDLDFSVEGRITKLFADHQLFYWTESAAPEASVSYRCARADCTGTREELRDDANVSGELTTLTRNSSTLFFTVGGSAVRRVSLDNP